MSKKTVANLAAAEVAGKRVHSEVRPAKRLHAILFLNSCRFRQPRFSLSKKDNKP